MRTILLIAILAGFLLSCNEDPLLDPLEEAVLVQSEQNLAASKASKAVTRPLKIRVEGTLTIEGEECAPLAQVNVEGIGNATHLGKFSVSIIWCTNFAEINTQNGTQVAANGDELYFYAVGFGTDENGDWTDYVYDGGTGRFEFATGDLRLYGIVTFTGPTGVFTNSGEGTLTY